ncbi:MAG: hypothetical protein ACK5LS_10430 [Propioniciclava sp.]
MVLPLEAGIGLTPVSAANAVVADGDQQLHSGDNADAFRGQQAWVDVLDQRAELVGGLVDVVGEVLAPPRQPSQRGHRGVGDTSARVIRS